MPVAIVYIFKFIHIQEENSQFFVCGGSSKTERQLSVFSKKACVIDVSDGQVTRLADMIKSRQAHGLCRVGNFVYCCGGLNQGWNSLDHCERFDLNKRIWTQDVPSMNSRKFSMTVIKVNFTWLYSFGGVSANQHQLY